MGTNKLVLLILIYWLDCLVTMKKVYGAYKVLVCPFCGSTASVKNPQGVPTCTKHSKMLLEDMKCLCGAYLDIKEGKFGPFFTCENCGIIRFSRGLEINDYPLKSIIDL